MKTRAKKVSVAFRIESGIADQLKKRSGISGISQARILEMALAHYFEKRMKQQMREVAEKIASFDIALGQPQELLMAA